MAELIVDSLTVTAQETTLVHQASFALTPGRLIALLGPNGAGKSTLLRASLGLINGAAGEALLDGAPIASWSPIERARRISYLPQIRPLAWPARTYDVAALGRFAYGGAPARLSDEDRAAISAALAGCDLTHLADRAADTLSGGELARLHCARAFATGAPLLIADEPAAALDPLHQFSIMTLIRRFVDDGGGALVVLHDAALAARYADEIIWMQSGRIVDAGPASDQITAERMAQIYGVRATILDSADGLAVQLHGPVADL